MSSLTTISDKQVTKRLVGNTASNTEPVRSEDIPEAAIVDAGVSNSADPPVRWCHNALVTPVNVEAGQLFEFSPGSTTLRAG